MNQSDDQKRTLIVFTHPNTQSFNHDVLATIVETLEKKGHQVRIRDLYQDEFNPVLSSADFLKFQKKELPSDIASEQDQLLWANHLVFIYPVWWWDRPAILKGWIDRVLTHGFAFKIAPGPSPDTTVALGLLKHRRCLVVATAGNALAEMQRTGADEVIRKSMVDGTLVYCGVQAVQCAIFGSIPRISDGEKQENINKIKDIYLRDW